MTTANPSSAINPGTISLFDIELGCPRCGTLKSIVPTLKLFYSTCCGFVICSDCIQTKLFTKSTKQSIVCNEPNCGELINEKSFTVENIHTQRYNKQLR